MYDSSPLLKLLLPLIFGIITGEYLTWTAIPLLCLTGIMLTIFVWIILVFFVLNRFKHTIGWLTFIFMIIMGILMCSFEHYKHNISVSNSEGCNKGIVVTEVKETAKCRMFHVRLQSGGYVQLYLRKGSSNKLPSVGDAIMFYGRIKEIQNWEEATFDYAHLMKHRGIIGQCFTTNYKSLTKAESKCLYLSLPFISKIKIWGIKIRTKLLHHYDNLSMPSHHLSILQAMTLGKKDNLDKKTKQTFSHTGTSHILALSGLHLGILTMLLLTILHPFRGNVWRNTCISFTIVLIIWTFVIITGAATSTIRAAIMFSIYTILYMVKHDTNSFNSLILAAFIILLVSPLELFEVGFQLSFLSVFFIVASTPFYNSIRPKGRFKQIGCDFLFITLIAQIGTMPLVAYLFHNIPLLSLFSNIIVIPCTYIIIGGALLYFIFSPITIIHVLFGQILVYTTNLMMKYIGCISNIPYSHIEVHPDIFTTILLYALLLICINAMTRKITF